MVALLQSVTSQAAVETNLRFVDCESILELRGLLVKFDNMKA